MNYNLRKRIYSVFTCREILLLLCILLLGGSVQFVTADFLKWGNIVNILNNNAVYGILGIGITLVIATGNIDISVGAQFAVAGICAAKSAIYLDGIGKHFVPALILTAAGTGLLLGFLNGALVVTLRLPAVIVTLGTLSVMRGCLYLVTGGEWISLLPKWYTDIANVRVAGVKLAVVVWFALLLTAVFLFRYLKIGKIILAAGNNREFAERIGIRVQAVYMMAFLMWGVIIGIAALFFVAQIGTIQPSAGNGYEMTLIAAAIIGGNKLDGGTFKAVGTTLGILLLGVINNILVLARIPMYWQNLITGLVIISAIVISALSDGKERDMN